MKGWRGNSKQGEGETEIVEEEGGFKTWRRRKLKVFRRNGWKRCEAAQHCDPSSSDPADRLTLYCTDDLSISIRLSWIYNAFIAARGKIYN